MDTRFADRWILVTGASSGIGRETAIRLSKEGAYVCLLARSEEALKETASMMDRPNEHCIIPFDLLDFDHYNDVFRKLKEKEIILNGMVHCAGTTMITPLRSISKELASKMMDIHYYSFLELVKRYAKRGVSDGGSIVAISAINAHTPQKCMTAYAAAKSAVETVCRNLALELSDKGIRINSVVVGGLDNDMTGSLSHEAAEAVNSSYENPVQRQLLGLGKPSSISRVIAFLLSEDAEFITGREIYADGGLL